MKQLAQKLGSGEMLVLEVPVPQLGDNEILVRNHFSVISAGTEASTVVSARKNLLAKAKERPQQVKQVIDSVKSQGIKKTFDAVQKKLDAYSPLGYSSSGQVISLGKNVKDFRVGDFVACAGAGFANHAEIVSVPSNLCVRVDSSEDLKEASFNTLGAIALQGVRQGDFKLGESCVVIGLGLLGQITSSLLKASGIKVIGIDISDTAISSAVANEVVDFAFNSNTLGLMDKVLEITNGYGSDGVIITAATKSLSPINLAGALCRQKGVVVLVGSVPTGFDREPFWYKKELELKMSCSYGPGRYDLAYEEKGIDYPYPYVRWTERRNMEAFQALIRDKAIDVSKLITHEYELDEVMSAYDMILEKSEPFLGIVIKYDIINNIDDRTIKYYTDVKTLDVLANGKTQVSFIGAGSYAQGNLLPFLGEDVKKDFVLTNSGTTSKRVAEKFKFNQCAHNVDQIWNSSTNLVFVATRHDTHSKFILEGISHSKNIFVEKPLCIREEDLYKIAENYFKSKSRLMVGFNRRFSPLGLKAKDILGSGKMNMIYRVNAGTIPSDNWIQDIDIGGGRLVGEVCHFIDFFTFINGSLPVSLSAIAFGINLDVINLSLTFKNGSIGVISFLSNGNRALNKEYIELHSHGSSIIIDDFKSMRILSGSSKKVVKLRSQDKGQSKMIAELKKSHLENVDFPISFQEIYAVTLATFKALDSIKTNGQRQEIAELRAVN